MRLNEIREQFLAYFKSKNHLVLPSSSVVPHEDPTLLFNNAGMNPFKDIFLGLEVPNDLSVTTSQKCIRVGGKHNDLENVGHTTRHLTFFEMLGNFSFGSYFKKEAIQFSFDLSTNIFKLDPQFLWASIFEQDDESFELWRAFLPENRIVRFGEKENFWSMGAVGPCGPCSELLYDRGERFSNATHPHQDVQGERFFEFWNLVFMQYNKNEEGVLEELPKPMIDTGMGLERIASLLQNKDSVFAIDLFQAFIQKMEQRTHTHYAKNPAAFHVIADHLRMLSFAICDGAQPSNTERGYVLRKILRRASRYGKNLGLNTPFLHTLVQDLVQLMGGDYKELKVNQLRIETLILQEEESFLHTMQRGGNLLQKMIEQSQGTLSGNDCFKLKDTYGFPFEEIELIAKDYDLKVDTKGFLELEQQAKELSKGAHKTTRQLANPTYYNEYLQLHGTTTFLGYARLECQSIVQAILVDNEPTSTLKTEQKGLLLLDQTCFYAEMGGQIGDLGTIEVENGLFVVEDTIAPINGLIAHVGFVKQGSIQIKQTARAKVDQNKRSNTEKNHTATHLLHYALCHLLGEHIKQAGSYVGSTHLRFDFSHPKPLSRKELLAIENMVNEKIISNLKVETFETPFEKVKHNSKIKQFFGEKYSKYVRVVDIDFSKELCGGTHVDHLGKIGFFKITKETSIGQGLRRIEAVTAMEAVHVCHFYEEKLLQLSEKLNAPIDTLIEKVEHLQIEKKEIEQNLKQLEKQKIEHLATQLLEKENKCLFEVVDVEKKQLIPLVDLLFSKANSLICCLARIDGEMVQIVIKLSKDHLKQLSAKTLLQKAFEISKGRGGGSDQLAQGTLESAKAINDVLKSLKEHVLKLC